MPITGYPYSPTGIGYSDIVLFVRDMKTKKYMSEVYEIKPYSNYTEKLPRVPRGTRSTNGIQQREGYIEGLRSMKYEVNDMGTTFNPRGWTYPSAMRPGYNLRYYTYPQEPGMIYYSYVTQPKKVPVAVSVPATTKKKKKYSILDRAVFVFMGLGATVTAGFLYADDVIAPGLGAVDNGVATAAVGLAITYFASAISGERKDEEECVQ